MGRTPEYIFKILVILIHVYEKQNIKLPRLFIEPLTFDGEGNYALSNVKEFDVTEGFLNLGEEVTECQDQESFEECNTRKYLQLARKECGCTPFSLSHLNDTVSRSRRNFE